MTVHLIEASARLQALQAAAVPVAEWHQTLDSLPAGPMLLVANEFLDALPIRQFVRRDGAWMERHVAAGAFVERPAADPPPAPISEADAPDGTVVERGAVAATFAATLAARLARDGGAALIVDYGPAESAAGDSLQALAAGETADPLARPGSADLTAHVDFAALADAARHAGAAVFGPLPQGVFLTRLGLFQRTDQLARTQKPARALALIEAARRLAEPNRMGRLFKAMAICQPDLPPPPGFSA